MPTLSDNDVHEYLTLRRCTKLQQLTLTVHLGSKHPETAPRHQWEVITSLLFSAAGFDLDIRINVELHRIDDGPPAVFNDVIAVVDWDKLDEGLCGVSCSVPVLLDIYNHFGPEHQNDGEAFIARELPRAMGMENLQLDWIHYEF